MSRALWQLDSHQARFSLDDELSGVVDLLNPGKGVRLCWGNHAGVTAFAVDLPSVSAAEAASCLDAWARGGDLVATYAQTENRATRGQVYWRVHRCGGPSHTPAIDLIASVQTSLLDSDPTLQVHSRVHAKEVMRMSDAISQPFVSVETNDTRPLYFEPSSGPACFVFRTDDSNPSYIEMVHPADFTQCALVRLPQGETQISNRLFRGRLEKGVILRARLRAMFSPRDRDSALASACYADFAASEPPLTV